MKFSKEAKVGILAIIAIAILYVGFNFLKGIDFFDPSNTYYAVYNNVDGLTESNPVKINGYRIGRVSSIKLQQSGENTRMVVGFDINDELEIYEGSEAVLVDDGLLGGKAVVLNLNRQGRVLQPEDTLKGSVEKALTELIKEKADPLVASVDTTLTRVNNLLGDLGGETGAAGRLQQTAEMLQYMVAENRRDINVIVTNLKVLTETLNDPNNGIAPFMGKMNQLADSLNDLQLKQTVAGANQAITNLEQITQSLQQGDGSLGKLLQDDSLYNNLNKSSADLDRLILDIQQNPSRYIDLRFSILQIGGGGK